VRKSVPRRDLIQRRARCLLSSIDVPVIGHTLVGLATAIQFEPESDRDGAAPGRMSLALWPAAVVVLSYVPDILAQLGSMAGVRHAGLAGHSLVVGVLAGILLGVAWAAVSRLSLWRLVLTASGAIMFHDLLDILQSTDRAPLWPWSTRIVSAGSLLPRRTLPETALFLGAFIAFVLWRRLTGRTLGTLSGLFEFRSLASSAPVWVARALIVVVLMTAVSTRAVRSQRERAARDAARLNAQGRYAEALRVADTADRWPWPVRPGRLDLIRGEAHEGLGEAAVAERYYLQAYDEDPTNFWAVADLAEFHAASNVPLEERRKLVQPYADELRRKFPRHEQLHTVMARIDRKLGQAD